MCSFEGLYERSITNVEGMDVQVASIDDLIRMKSLANRLKDQVHLMELNALKKLLEQEGDR